MSLTEEVLEPYAEFNIPLNNIVIDTVHSCLLLFFSNMFPHIYPDLLVHNRLRSSRFSLRIGTLSHLRQPGATLGGDILGTARFFPQPQVCILLTHSVQQNLLHLYFRLIIE